MGKEFGVPTRDAQAFIDNYFDKYAKVRELLDKIIREAQLTGKVKTLFGRHRYVPEIGSRNHATREAAKRMAVNAPIQGTAADLIKKAMVDLKGELTDRGLQSRLLLPSPRRARVGGSGEGGKGCYRLGARSHGRLLPNGSPTKSGDLSGSDLDALSSSRPFSNHQQWVGKKVRQQPGAAHVVLHDGQEFGSRRLGALVDAGPIGHTK